MTKLPTKAEFQKSAAAVAAAATALQLASQITKSAKKQAGTTSAPATRTPGPAIQTIENAPAQVPAQDHAKLRIEELLYSFSQAPQGSLDQVICLGKLFFTTNVWLNNANRGEANADVRYKSAVDDLFLTVVNRLTEETNLTVNTLPNWLSATFGKNLQSHGVNVDVDNQNANYYTPEELKTYRLIFRDGLAWQQQWHRNSATVALCDTGRVYYGFVVTLGGDFYARIHEPATANRFSGKFHSSYLHGDTALCAGNMKIRQGVIEMIDNETGHYASKLENFLGAIEMLGMLGVDLDKLDVNTYSAFSRGKSYTGRDFLTVFQPQYQNALDREIDGAEKMLQPGRTKLSERLVQETWERHAAEIGPIPESRREAAVELFREHWKPRSAGGAAHGSDRSVVENCDECKKYRHLWEAFRASAWKVGLKQAELPKVLPAIQATEQKKPDLPKSMKAWLLATIVQEGPWGGTVQANDVADTLETLIAAEAALSDRVNVIPATSAKRLRGQPIEKGRRLELDGKLVTYLIDGTLSHEDGEYVVEMKLVSQLDPTSRRDGAFWIHTMKFASVTNAADLQGKVKTAIRACMNAVPKGDPEHWNYR